MTRYLIRGLTFLCISIIAISSSAQTVNYFPQELSPALLKTDFSLLRDTLQKIHPGIYRYQSKETLDRLFDSCFLTIRHSMTVTDFYALTSFVIASLGDGHTNCKLPDQVKKDYMNKVKVFPAMVMFIHNKAFIYCCNQTCRIRVIINKQSSNG